MSEQRAVPFYCPFCGDEDLRPHSPDEQPVQHGAWHCRSCARVFSLKLLGLALRPVSTS
jgi:transposase-like protein